MYIFEREASVFYHIGETNLAVFFKWLCAGFISEKFAFFPRGISRYRPSVLFLAHAN